MILKVFHTMFHHSVAIDLGTANTRVYAPSCSQLTETPSSISLVTKKTKDLSDEYLQYINKRLSARPLRGGVIVDLKNAIMLLKPLIRKSRKYWLPPVSLASAPMDTTDRERDILRKAIIDAGASQVAIMPEVWAAAIGAGIDITQKNAQLLIDIGDGVTDMAVFRDGRIIYSSSIRVACSDIQKAVRSLIVMKYKMQLHDNDIEKLTNVISFIPCREKCREEFFRINGFDIFKRNEVNFCVGKMDIINSIEPKIDKIIKQIENFLKKLPEKIYLEIIESGICLTGGGACIEGMDTLIALKTKIDVIIPPDPTHAVINGAIQTLNYWDGKKNWWENIAWPKISS